MEPFIAEIRLFAGNFAPRGWAFCDGQLLPIAQNAALFSLLGTTYGGDGRTTFALPDLRGRVPVHVGQGPGLSNYTLGESAGSESVTLTSNQIPAHTHTFAAPCSDSLPDTANPSGAAPAHTEVSSYSNNPNASQIGGSTGPAGGSQPHPNLQPFLTVSFIIALEGIFPSRN